MDFRKFFFAMMAGFLLVALVSPWSAAQANPLPPMRVLAPQQNKIDAVLQSKLNHSQSGDLTVIVTLRQQADLSKIEDKEHSARSEKTIRALHSAADASEKSLKGLLTSYKNQGRIKNFQAFWVFNGFSVTASPDVIQELAQQADVLSITSDDLQIVPDYAPAEPNISLVNAPAMWSQGFSGQGVVVANMDSGVDVSHADLSTRWRGGTNSWFDPYGQHSSPADLSGHGTQTMGIMVGGDAGGTSIGMAPGAKWIAVKIFNDAGASTATAIHSGFQWLLDPDGNPATDDAPDVVNNSWSYANPGCYLDFETDLQALRTAGILPVFAAGNGGPSSGTSYSPANNPSAFAVGAINNNSQLYAYSSRGPTTCGGSSGPFPELVAPGVSIKTTDLYGVYTNAYSGTSYAAPHVAGALALLLSAYPNLSARDQQSALINSAIDLGAFGPDDVYGYGRLDILAAFNWLQLNPTPTPAPMNTATPLPTFTATPLPTSTATPLPTSTPTQPAPTTIHVGDLDRSAVLSGSKWNASVTILIHNNNEQPVANATVSGKWINGATGTVTCVTNTSGLCTVSKTGLSTKTTSITFSVTGVTANGLTYKSSSNHDPDTDSNGTTINVPKP